MKRRINVTKGNPYPYGIAPTGENSINIVISMESDNCGILLYHKNNKQSEKIPFDTSFRVGNLYCVKLEDVNTKECEYCFFDDNRIFVDEYARSVAGNEIYGKVPKTLRGVFYQDDFDWGEDVVTVSKETSKENTLQTPFHQSLLYLLHVRGFTRHKSSGVSHKGTFEGIVEKIPYLKELGITAVELMPCYEFLEMEEKVAENERIPAEFCTTPPVLNYWGYKEGYYYAPKSAYAADSGNAVHSFKNLVKKLHSQGIEVLMQFYFPDTVSAMRIIDVLRYWVFEYHVDGFHLLGENIPADVLAADSLLKKTKLLYYGFPVSENGLGSNVAYKNLAECHSGYMYDIRRFLKGDERMLGNVLQHMKANPKSKAIVHYITETNGFTLNDLVSYDRKHNEENGENDMDGNPYNASWNCGAEGKTKKKSILDLRMKQMKNAFLLSLFTQSTPLLLAGDEFANSQNGNNNAYCQDNAISWLNWGDLEKQAELFSFVKNAIAFRKEHALLHRSTEYTMVDDLACGYPDLSYHSEEPWKCRYDDLTRHFGMLYCGDYSEDEGEKGSFIYLAVNMHWIPHGFVLPKLPKKMKWQTVFDTAVKDVRDQTMLSKNEITVKERSIQVLIAK